MIYNWLKIGTLIVTGRFLKPRWKGLLALLAFWFLVSFLHGEYRGYVELSGDTDYLIMAALTKIGLYLAGFLMYVLAVERKILKRTQVEIEQQHEAENPLHRDDGFDFIRRKKKLRSPAEQLLKKD